MCRLFTNLTWLMCRLFTCKQEACIQILREKYEQSWVEICRTEEQERFWVRTLCAGPWPSCWDITAGTAMGWCGPGLWNISRSHRCLHQTVLGKLIRSSFSEAANLTQGNNQNAEIYLRFLKELERRGTEMKADTQLLICGLGRPKEQTEATRTSSLMSVLPRAELACAMWVVRVPSQHHLASSGSHSAVRLHEPSPPQGRQRQRQIEFCLSHLRWHVPTPVEAQQTNKGFSRSQQGFWRVTAFWPSWAASCKANHSEKRKKGRNMDKFTLLCVASCNSV